MIEIKKLKTEPHTGLEYLVREPESKSGKRKALVLLHGVGSNEQDLFALAKYLPDDLLLISARGPFTLQEGRFAWYQVNLSALKPEIDVAQEKASRTLLEDFIRNIKQEYDIEELFLGGFSQGAIMSYTIGLTNPELVRGIVSLSGRILDEIKPLVQANPALQQLKVFIAHGSQDGTLPIAYARQAKEFLEPWGVQLSYYEFKTGHQITQEILNELYSFLK